MRELYWETADELDLAIAERLRKLRKRKGWTQAELALQSGVSLGSVKRFENSGLISLLSLTKLAMALGCEGDLKALFTAIPYSSIKEVIRENR